MKTPSAAAPAARKARGPDAAAYTGTGRRTHARCDDVPAHDAGFPASKVRRYARPSPNALARAGAPPTFATPLCPAPTPRIVRPPAATSTDAAADAVMAGWRVSRLVTQLARRTRWLAPAARVMATHRSMALPGVSATPTRSKPRSSPSRTIRVVYSGVYGQKKNPTFTARRPRRSR